MKQTKKLLMLLGAGFLVISLALVANGNLIGDNPPPVVPVPFTCNVEGDGDGVTIDAVPSVDGVFPETGDCTSGSGKCLFWNYSFTLDNAGYGANISDAQLSVDTDVPVANCTTGLSGDCEVVDIDGVFGERFLHYCEDLNECGEPLGETFDASYETPVGFKVGTLTAEVTWFDGASTFTEACALAGADDVAGVSAALPTQTSQVDIVETGNSTCPIEVFVDGNGCVTNIVPDDSCPSFVIDDDVLGDIGGNTDTIASGCPGNAFFPSSFKYCYVDSSNAMKCITF